MLFETQLKNNYAHAHNRLINGGTEKLDSVSHFPPIAIRTIHLPAPPPPGIQETKEIEAPQELSPKSTAAEKPTMWGLLRWVSVAEGVSITDLRGAKHSKSVYRVRFIFCYLARVYAGMSLAQIGAFIGGRDHTTVLNAVNKIRVYRLSDAQLCQDVAYYETQLDRDEGGVMRCPHCGSVIPSYPH